MKILSISLPQTLVDSCEDLLLTHGALSVTLAEGGQDEIFEPLPETTPLWQDTTVQGLFEDATDFSTLQLALLEQFPEFIASVRIESVPDIDWVEATQKLYQPIEIGRLLIVPSWHEGGDRERGAVVVRINPGLAFGTGTHATTKLCLAWLAEQDLTGKSVVDFGCGSGILSLAALALGADKVYAVDHDPQALMATRQNGELNGWDEARLWVGPTLGLAAQADVILANILAEPLIELAPLFKKILASQGTLVLSGILSGQVERVCAAYVPCLTVVETTLEENWARCVLLQLYRS